MLQFRYAFRIDPPPPYQAVSYLIGPLLQLIVTNTNPQTVVPSPHGCCGLLTSAAHCGLLGSIAVDPLIHSILLHSSVVLPHASGSVPLEDASFIMGDSMLLAAVYARHADIQSLVLQYYAAKGRGMAKDSANWLRDYMYRPHRATCIEPNMKPTESEGLSCLERQSQRLSQRVSILQRAPLSVHHNCMYKRPNDYCTCVDNS